MDVARPITESAAHRSRNVQACERRAGSTYVATGNDLRTLAAAAAGSDHSARATSIRRWYWTRIRDPTAPRRARPSPPASRYRPPLSSDSDDDLSDITVIDIGLETDAAVVSLDRYSDISEPGSPSAAASLDRAAAMASATLSSTAAAEGEPADDYGILPSLDLASFVGTEGTSQSVETEGSGR